MIDCRLATLSDNTPENQKRVLEMARTYCTASKDVITPEQVLEIFQAYTASNSNTYQFWLVIGDGALVGFMITSGTEYNGRLGLQIGQGYLDQTYAGSRTSHECMRAVEELAKAHSLSFVSCITGLDPDVYARWLEPAGYKRAYTSFLKEI